MRQRTIDRSRFMRYVEKYLQRKVSSIWRIEWKQRRSGKNRGKIACHIHLLLYGVEFIPHHLMVEWWRACLAWEGYVHVWFEKTYDGEGAAKYVAKYCAKKSESGYLVNHSYLNTEGRHWGITRSKQIPRFAPKIFWNLPAAQVLVLKEVACALLPFYDVRYDSSFTLLGKHAEKIATIFWANNLDIEAVFDYLNANDGGEVPGA